MTERPDTDPIGQPDTCPCGATIIWLPDPSRKQRLQLQPIPNQQHGTVILSGNRAVAQETTGAPLAAARRHHTMGGPLYIRHDTWCKQARGNTPPTTRPPRPRRTDWNTR